jgi:predicted amidohydrolase
MTAAFLRRRRLLFVIVGVNHHLYHPIAVRAMSASATTTKIAAVAQLKSCNNKLTNLVNIAKCAHLSKQSHAAMLFLPECFGYMGLTSEETLRNAEPSLLQEDEQPPTNDEYVTKLLESVVCKGMLDVETPPPSPVAMVDDDDESSAAASISLLHGLQVIARASQLWISAGGMHERVPKNNEQEEGRVYNTHIILDSSGEIIQTYRKIHLFDVQIPQQGVNLQESKTTKPGNQLVVCHSPVGRLGLSTCYDVRFPEQYTALAQTMGAQILLVPSAFTVPTGAAHWHVLLRARAIETQCYVLAAAQCGQHNERRSSYGHALCVDPWGRVVADAGGDSSTSTAPTIVTCEIDLDSISSIRQRMPIQAHREAAKSLLSME